MENISLTQRIVGAIVIISLAIIFIPALLETDKLDPGKATSSPIPEVPREISTIVFQLNEETGKFEGEGLSAPEQFEKDVANVIKHSANEVELTPKEVIPIADAEESQKQAVANQPVVPKPVADDGKQHSWMLQLASFKEEKNAIKLRDKLRKKQYVAHVDERKFSNGSIWRVRIGPVLSKKKIQQIQSVLEKEMNLKGLIVRRR